MTTSTPQATPNKPTKFPVGMIFVCIYIGYSILSTIPTFFAPAMLLGPIVIGETVSFIYKIVTISVLALCLYGILKRTQWSRNLTLGWFGFGILYVLLHFSLSYINKADLPELYSTLLPNQGAHFDEFSVMLVVLFSTSFVIVVNGVICWYVYDRDDFFVDSQRAA